MEDHHAGFVQEKAADEVVAHPPQRAELFDGIVAFKRRPWSSARQNA
jgi:hypothetical protein